MQALTCGIKPFKAAKAVRSSDARRSAVLVRAHVQKPAEIKEKVPAFIKPAALTALANIAMSMPAHAEAGKIFDFNLTLPVMMGEFLILMVFMDKFWFGPVGKLLDDRDSQLREKLALVKDNSGDISGLREEAEKLISEARAFAQKQMQDAKMQVNMQCEKELAEAKKRVEAELAKAMLALEAERDSAINELDDQVNKLTGEVLSRLLPEGLKV